MTDRENPGQALGSAETAASSSSAMGWGPKLRKVTINVFANEDEAGLVDFSHEWKFDDEPLQPSKSGRIDLPAGKVAYQFKFQLQDRTTKKLKFIDPSEDAMWVAIGTDCPRRAGNGAGQITFGHPYNTHHLIVDDLNSNVPAMLFKYALRFDGDPGDQVGKSNCPPYEYDPDFKNGGGNT